MSHGIIANFNILMAGITRRRNRPRDECRPEATVTGLTGDVLQVDVGQGIKDEQVVEAMTRSSSTTSFQAWLSPHPRCSGSE